MDIEHLFKRKINSFTMHNRIAVAVSGGPDSLALLLLTHSWALENDVKITVLTVNHNLRAEAITECQYVDEVSCQFGLSCEILTWQEPQAKQDKARIARYKLLTDWCKKNHVTQLLLGHHQNDQAETLLMRLGRGSGIDGLCAMHELSDYNGIQIMRPLLAFTKEQLIDYLNSKDMRWQEDPSNDDLKYDRTMSRHYIKNTNNPEQLIKRLALTSLHMQRAQQALLFYVKQEIERCVMVHELGYVDIDRPYLLSLPEEMVMRILIANLMIVGNKSYKPRYKNSINLYMDILQDQSNSVRTLHGCKIIKNSSTISIRREISCIGAHEVAITAHQAVIWDGRFLCTSDVSGLLCRNNDGEEIMKSLPLLKNSAQCIYPYADKLSSGFKLQFIFSELLLNVL